MKKPWFPSILFLFLITLWFIPVAANAASIGNPEILGGFGKIGIGLEYDSSHQNLQFNGGHQSLASAGVVYNLSFPPPDVGVSNMHINTQTEYIVGTFGIFKNAADVFAGIGINHAELGFDLNYIIATESHEIKDNSNIPWKVGVRAKLAKIGDVTIGGTAQYSSFDMNGRYRIGGRDLSILFPGNVSYDTRTRVREWQAALTAHTQVWMFDPYAGATYLKTSVKNEITISAPAGGEMSSYVYRITADAKEKDNVGMVIGTGIKLPVRNLSANLEGRFFNERAATASLNYRF